MKNHRYFTEQLGCKSRWSALIKIMEVNDILYLIIYPAPRCSGSARPIASPGSLFAVPIPTALPQSSVLQTRRVFVVKILKEKSFLGIRSGSRQPWERLLLLFGGPAASFCIPG